MLVVLVVLSLISLNGNHASCTFISNFGAYYPHYHPKEIDPNL